MERVIRALIVEGALLRDESLGATVRAKIAQYGDNVRVICFGPEELRLDGFEWRSGGEQARDEIESILADLFLDRDQDFAIEFGEVVLLTKLDTLADYGIELGLGEVILLESFSCSESGAPDYSELQVA